MDNSTNPQTITLPISLTAHEWGAAQAAAKAVLRGTDPTFSLTPSTAISALIAHLGEPLMLDDPRGNLDDALFLASGVSISLYTDGACSGNPGPGGWGAITVIHQDGEPEPLIIQDSGSAPDTTNNRMELTAVVKALAVLPMGASATLTTDSTYVKGGATRWMAKWKRNGWKIADGKPVKNQDLWRLLDQLLEDRQVAWKWVKSHNGNGYNEQADILARGAIPRP